MFFFFNGMACVIGELNAFQKGRGPIKPRVIPQIDIQICCFKSEGANLEYIKQHLGTIQDPKAWNAEVVSEVKQKENCRGLESALVIFRSFWQT